jgi:hypothetical protein
MLSNVKSIYFPTSNLVMFWGNLSLIEYQCTELFLNFHNVLFKSIMVLFALVKRISLISLQNYECRNHNKDFHLLGVLKRSLVFCEQYFYHH